MEVYYFQILLIGVTFYFQHILKKIDIVLVKNVKKTNIIGTSGLRVKGGSIMILLTTYTV